MTSRVFILQQNRVKYLYTSMDFAKKQLEKYGWKEGEGLGKNKAGISKPIRPKLKFDSVGLGHDAFEDINNTWWQRLYDQAAKNITTTKINDSLVLESVEDSLEITTKRKKSKKKRKLEDSMYKNFIKTAELNNSEEKKIIVDDEDEEPEEKKKKKEMTNGVIDLSEEELFKICGGRTLHKGARHRLKMNAKLARLEAQESLLEKQITTKKLKKKKKSKSETEEIINIESVEKNEKKNQKKKKRSKYKEC